ncbi:24845_t:CDS:2 [Gigaspora rosea]|nr:24845_t:CDS:2 [Gigaspora rosea]
MGLQSLLIPLSSPTLHDILIFFIIVLAGKGIGFNNNLESWKHNKAFLAQSIMTPSFWKEYIKEIEMIFEDSIKLMESKQQSSSFDINFKEWAVRLLAIEGYTKEPISKELSYKINIWIKSIIFHRLLPKFIATYVPPFNLFKKKYLKNDEWLKKYFDDLVEKRREEINQMKKYNSDILTTLICANTKNKLKDEEIRIIIYETFIGISTTTNSVSFLVYLLCKNPLIKEKVYAEIDKVFHNDKTRPITYDDISTIKLPYTEACVNESLCLISTVLYTLRCAIDDGNACSFNWKAGQKFIVHYNFIHLNKKHWEDPVKFNPERFIKNDEYIEKNSFILFGGGNKMCPARLLAMNSIKIIIVLFFRKYDIELVESEAPLKRSCVLLINECKELKVNPPSLGTTTTPMVPFGCWVRVPSNDCTTEEPAI